MQILSLELENIKSYQRQRIDFTAGLNAICGLNGSGKTTVLESIGFALFDHLPYSQGSFVREGEKSGTIRVRILARDDRPYEVVRRVGASSTYYVADADDGTRVVERRENVLDWIGTQALGIDGGADLAALFKNAVGVPQGTITTDFLGTPAQRKAVFDPLLRVQEYGRANEELRHTVSYLRDLSATTREEIARLETETGRIPDLRRQLEAQQQELKESEARLRDLEKCVAEAELQKQSLDSLEEQINRLGSELELWQSAVQAQEQVWHMQQDGVAAARRAVAVVAETEPGYRAVVAARERLKTLDVERTKRDLLQKELAGAQSNRQGIFGRIEQLDERLRSAGEAAARAATLVEAVREQERLEEQLQQVALARRDAAGLDRQIGERTTELTRIQSEVDSHAERLSQARAAAVEEQQLADVPVRLRDVGDRLARLEPLRRQADEITEEGKRLRLQHDRLAAQSQERLSLLHKIATLQLVATSLDEQIERQARLREEQVRIVSTIDFQEVARAELERANCPLLELRCPVVSTDSGALKAFTARVETLAARLQQVQDELAALVKPLEAAREAFLEV
ncbi:MAG TPA: SMC family ATPase, partial [Chloroflexota bacterium]